MNITWNAEEYAKDFSFVAQYGGDLISLLDIHPGMTCLDAGCGNGMLTQKLQEAGLLVTGMDSSPEQVALARTRYPTLSFFEGDVTNFTLPEPVDIVFSNAVFHWIDWDKQPALLACMYQVLKPGGQFVFEMGGSGNNQKIHEALFAAFTRRGHRYVMPFTFPSIGEYTPLLEAAGFTVRTALLWERPTPLIGPDGLLNWIQMFVKTPFVGIPEDEQDAIQEDAVEQLRPDLYRDGVWFADYVRLRCVCRRAA